MERVRRDLIQHIRWVEIRKKKAVGMDIAATCKYSFLPGCFILLLLTRTLLLTISGFYQVPLFLDSTRFFYFLILPGSSIS